MIPGGSTRIVRQKPRAIWESQKRRRIFFGTVRLRQKVDTLVEGAFDLETSPGMSVSLPGVEQESHSSGAFATESE